MNRGAVDLYLRQVKKELRCPAKRKRAFLAELEAGLREFAQELPDLAMEQLTDAFGTPQKQAQDFMETLDAKEIKKAFTWKKLVLICVLAVVLIWLVAVVTLWIDGHNAVNGYDVVYYGAGNSTSLLEDINK